jgi:hypothetical protein
VTTETLEPPDEKSEATCSACNRTAVTKTTQKGVAAIPKNWKLVGGNLFCLECRKSRMVTRVVWLPVASVVRGYEDGEWTEEMRKEGRREFWKSLRTSWTTLSRLYNWAVVEFAKTDSAPLVPNKKGTGFVPGAWDRKVAMNTVKALVTARWPEINRMVDATAKFAVLTKAEADYFRTRFERLVQCKTVLPQNHSGRLPLPVPMNNLSHVGVAEDHVFARLRVSGDRYSVKLKGGSRYRRQVSALKRCLSGEGKMGEWRIQERGGDIMVGIVVELPKDLGVRTLTTVRVQTCWDRMLQVWVDDRPFAWNLNDDQIRSVCLAKRHAEYLAGRPDERARGYMGSQKDRRQRWSEDLKMERRRPHEHSEAFDDHRRLVSSRYANRLTDYCHKVAAILTNLAVRNNAGRVEYDDADQQFAPGFPYFRLRALVEEKVRNRGIEFVHASAAVAVE